MKNIFRSILGNQGSSLGDEPSTVISQRDLQHFDHSFKGELHSACGSLLCNTFGGNIKFAKRPINIICKSGGMDIIEEVGISNRKQVELHYSLITGLSWDHGSSEVKFDLKKADEDEEETNAFVIFTMANSVEFEGEVKLRLSGLAASMRGFKVPSPMYIGMFAGASKPKPFQRKRPNLSKLPTGKLPPLAEMRNLALELHRNNYYPCPQGESRRENIALQHIYEGCNTFSVTSARGMSVNYRSDAIIVVSDESIVYRSRGGDMKVEFMFSELLDWNSVESASSRRDETGVELVIGEDAIVFFGVTFIRDVKHTLEYFWNKYKVSAGQENEVKLGSTHGRPIVSMHTLSGEISPSEPPVGQTDVVDQDGIFVRPGAKMVPRRQSIGGMAPKEPKMVPPENREVKRHWHKVVLHQGWLLKQGGVGVGNAKAWIKRYFVLYKTSQGHFLVYYSDFTECPMYTTEKNHRNIVDLAKATFIRPGSNKSDSGDIPPYCFDIVTTEREWTLCAESQENVLKWLKLINFAVDADVAILPDEELLFKVKPKVDPMGILNPTDYSTTLKVSANGISVCSPDFSRKDGSEKEFYFWVYTDFYKWSLLSQGGKLALLVNVFADSSFSRRNEYIFRNKDAVRLATAIEFFIEKFMSVMHIRLETQEGAFDAVAADAAVVDSQCLHAVRGDEEVHEDEIDFNAADVDLLDLDGDGPAVPPASAPPPIPPSLPSKQNGSSVSQTVDLFGDDPFGQSNEVEASAPALPAKSKPSHAGNSLLDDLMDSGTAVSKPIATASMSADPFASDPFGEDLFNSAPATKQEKVAPPLTPFQIAQHKSWLAAALANNKDETLFYDDGVLRITTKVEVRGSQSRLSINYSNNSPAVLSGINVVVDDPTGLLRFELGAAPSTLSGLGRATQLMMAECIKPAAPGPAMTITYVDALSGRRSNTLTLPLMVVSFIEPLTLSSEDFSSRWQMLVGPGQEGMEILKPTRPIIPAEIHAALVTTLKLGRISGMPDSSDYVVYGAGSLRTGALTPAGEKINVGCLVKIEMNVQVNAMRVTLRTLHPAATLAILQAVKLLFL